METITAVLVSATPPADFSPQEYQLLIEKYLTLSQENDRFVKAIRSGNQVDIDHVRRVLQTDFPLFVRLQDYFSRLRTGGLKSVGRAPFVSEDPAFGDGGIPSRSVDVNMEGDSEMKLASEYDLGAVSTFSGTETSVFTERPSTVPSQGPFGIRFSNFPPRVISQMLSTHTDVAVSSCRSPPHFSFARMLTAICSLVEGAIYLGRFRACQSSEEVHEGADDWPECYEWERYVRTY